MFRDVLKRLRHFDAYQKPLEDFRVKTLSGAVITIVCTVCIVILFCYEWNAYRTIDVDQELFVDLSRNQKLTINLDVTFPRLPCDLLSLDVMDVSGENQNDVAKGLKKIRIDKLGSVIRDDEAKAAASTITTTVQTTSTAHNETALDTAKCLSCYGAEASNIPCCNDCASVRAAYRQKNWHFSPFGVEQCKRELEESGRSMQAAAELTAASVERLLKSAEGCRLSGHLEVNKVAGNFHIAPGVSFQQSHMHVHDIKHLPLSKFNTGHFFDVFSFGDEYPNQINPLEKKNFHTSQDDIKADQAAGGNMIDFGMFKIFQGGSVDMNADSNDEAISYSYFLKVVPTTYEYLSGECVNNTYQYSVTKSFKRVSGMSESKLPGVFVNYELSPIMVKFIERSPTFTHFLTGCCAIIGGLFTVAGMLDAFTYKYYSWYKKNLLNKLT